MSKGESSGLGFSTFHFPLFHLTPSRTRAGVTAQPEPPEPPRDAQQQDGESDSKTNAREADAAQQCLGGNGGDEGDGNKKREHDPYPSGVNRDRELAGLVKAPEQLERVFDPHEPEGNRRKHETDRVNDGERRDDQGEREQDVERRLKHS